MAEVAGLVAGLTSLSIQLGENAVKIKRLCDTFKAAPQIVQDVAERVELFATLCQRLDSDLRLQNNSNSYLVARFATRCQSLNNRLGAVVVQLQASLHKSSTKGRIKTVFKQYDLESICAELDSATLPLIVACQDNCKTLQAQSQVLMYGRMHSQDLALQQDISSRLHAQSSDLGQMMLLLNQTLTVVTESHNMSSLQTVCSEMKKPGKKLKKFNRPTHSSRSVCRQQTKGCRKWRLQFSPWFTSQTWTMSFSTARTGWDIAIRTSNLVASNALIFEVCREGNLDAVKDLFDRGLASPYDHSDGWITATSFRFPTCVLTEAAASGNFTLCQFLLECGGYPSIPEGIQDPLTSYLTSFFGPLNTSTVQAMYRLFLSQEDLSEDDPSRWFASCPDASCIPIINEYCLEDIKSGQSLDQRLEMAMTVIHERGIMTPELFLAILGQTSIDPLLARAVTPDGCTALHAIAVQISLDFKLYYSLFRDLRPTAWAPFVRDLLKQGADVHHLNSLGQSPLAHMLQCQSYMYAPDNPNLRKWASIMSLAGQNLDSYGSTEMGIWKALTARNDYVSAQEIVGWTFGPTPDDWVLHRSSRIAIDVFEPDCPPGTWPVLDERNAWILPWYPEVEDFLETPFTWRITQTIRIPRDDRDESWMCFSRDISVYRILTDGSKDDWSAEMELAHQDSKKYGKRRSASLPRWHGSRWRSSQNMSGSSWTGHWHMCPLSGRLAKGHYSGRQCASLHRYEEEADVHWEMLDRSLRSFRRRYHSEAELRALPYEAYYPRYTPWNEELH